jgi:hypothetical protein
VRVKGTGSAEDGALLKAALLPLTCPAAAIDSGTAEPVQDPHDHGARLWDALVTAARQAIDTDLAPTTHGIPARLLVTVEAAT